MRRLASDYIPFLVDEDGYERIVFGEVLVPGQINVYGDFHDKASVKQFAYGFMINGFGIDRDHENESIADKVRIVESFIARENDPDFVEGAWVVALHVLDDAIWDDVLSGELNGFSYEALVAVLPVEVVVPNSFDFIGVTYPSSVDGHTHTFYARLDDNGRVIAGGTNEVNGHSHLITSHTFTEQDEAGGHRHRFSLYEEYEETA